MIEMNLWTLVSPAKSTVYLCFERPQLLESQHTQQQALPGASIAGWTWILFSLSKRKGVLVILSSPSGAGKTSIARALVEGNENFLFSVSATTRKSRPGEVNGREYHFLTVNEFQKKIEDGQFWSMQKFSEIYMAHL